MSTAVAFGTLKFVKTLKAAGVDEKQTEAHAEAMREVQDSQLMELATKGDLRELKLEIMREIHLLKWMLGLLMAGVLALVLKTFFHH
ncbi:MAG: DUF1640 domain-containing protein [Magnetococcales bacterium]|nr:DUF1640 domain-containing protein [Magnetococcales bacterium]